MDIRTVRNMNDADFGLMMQLIVNITDGKAKAIVMPVDSPLYAFSCADYPKNHR